MAAKASAEITLMYLIDIEATYRYYLLQSSTLAKPSKPTTNPPSNEWTDSEPTYTSGSTNSLYYVDLTVFTDGSFNYSSVSLSSAYEAAKEAYNKAQNAEDSAEEAAKVATNYMYYDSNNGLQIGNKTSGSWVGYRTKIESDSFNVLDENGNVLSKFGANEIHLGSQNNSANIYMCNDDLVVSTSDYEGYTYSEFLSDRIGLRTTDRAGMNVIKTIYSSESGNPIQHQITFQGYQPGLSGSNPYDHLKAEIKATAYDPNTDSTKLSEIDLCLGAIDMIATGGVSIQCGSDYIIFLDGDSSVTGSFDARSNANVGGTLNVNSGAIELNNGGTLSNYGGFIDFHYNKATSDYTSRIIEDANGQLNLIASNGVKANGSKVMTAADVFTGTWTASINLGSISNQKCTYMKVGNMVTISFFISGTGGTGSANTNFYISGAPYTPNSTANWYGGGGHVQGLYDTTGYPVTGCAISSSDKRIYFRTAQAGGTATSYIRGNNGGVAFYLSGSITYPT